MIKQSVRCQAILLINAITISRYLFIFWLKNPGVVWDDFWSFYITLWIIIFSSLFNFVYFYLPGPQPLSYYLCSYIEPQTDGNLPKRPTLIFEVFSVFVMLIINIRIFMFKRKSRSNTNSNKRVGTIFHQRISVSISDKGTISDFKSNIYSIINIILLAMLTMQGNTMTMKEVRDNPAYIYLIHLTGPGIFIFVFAILHYIRHAPLRKIIYRELNDCLKCGD